MTKEKLRKVCPFCGHDELYYELGGYSGWKYHCKNCDYMGVFVLDANEEMIKEIQEEYEKKKSTKSIK
jgi:transposase-like protein